MKGFVVALLGYILAVRGQSFVSNMKDLVFKNRAYLPYGPDLARTPIQPSNELWEGFGFGLDGVKTFAYDANWKFIYALSAQGYISIVDYGRFPPILTPFGLDLAQKDIRDLAVCGEKLYVSVNEANALYIYTTVRRSAQAKPVLEREVPVEHPGPLTISQTCQRVAVANLASGKASAKGGVTIITGLDSEVPHTADRILFDQMTDADLEARNVHMPLSEKSMEYWDLHSDLASDISWETLRQIYNPSLLMNPTSLRFSQDETMLHVNIQSHSALVTIDVAGSSIARIDGYGLKEWTSGEGIDLVQDQGCSKFVTSPVLHSLRSPSSATIVEIDGSTYAITTDEGSTGFSLDDFQEVHKAGDILNGGYLDFRKATTPESFYSVVSPEAGTAAPFNKRCSDFVTGPAAEFCAPNLQISLGSSAVDYTDPTAPSFDKIVAVGGRGVSIFKVPQLRAALIEHVWDSGSDFEKHGCSVYDWAHNGIQNEYFSPLYGAYWNLKQGDRDELLNMNDPSFQGCTNAGNGSPGSCPISGTIDDKSLENGMGPTSSVVAPVCGHLILVACAKNNANCLIYDITDITNPIYRKTINLSQSSATLSVGVAYERKELGEINPSTLVFVNAVDSPTGKSGIIFGGSLSSTVSFWEFECNTPVPAAPTLPPIEAQPAAVISTPTEAPVLAPSTHPACSVCGENKSVTNPTVKVQFTGQDRTYSCADIEFAGKAGVISPSDCAVLESAIADPCGCSPTATTPTPFPVSNTPPTPFPVATPTPFPVSNLPPTPFPAVSRPPTPSPTRIPTPFPTPPTPFPTPFPTVRSITTIRSEQAEGDDGLDGGAVAGIVIGVAAGLLIIFGMVCFTRSSREGKAPSAGVISSDVTTPAAGAELS